MIVPCVRFLRNSACNLPSWCVQARPDQYDKTIQAVPEAVVHHPYWRRPLRQVIGWATGDVRCLGALPHATFYAPPNWAEQLLLVFLFRLLLWSPPLSELLACIGCILLAELLINVVISPMRGSRGIGYGVLVAVPGWLQDITRLHAKLCSCYLNHIFLNQDWMDGQEGYVLGSRLKLLVTNVLAAALFFSVRHAGSWWAASAIAWALVCSSALVRLRFSQRAFLSNFLTMLQPLQFPPDEEGRPDPLRFVVLAYQRTGSNLLCGLLHQHPQLAMHNELFSGKARGGAWHRV
jgi:hypothetical protein